MNQTLKDWKKETIRCIRCGSCQNFCPVFKELQAESTVARGKVKLIQGVIDNEVELTEGFIYKMSLCLACKACVQNCPSGTKVDKLIEIARKEIVETKGLSPLKKFIFRIVLRNRWIFNTGMKTGTLFQGLVFRKGPDGKGILPRMPLGLDKRRLLAPIASRSFRNMYQERLEVLEPKLRVGFFTGCMINFVYTETGRSLLNVLRHNQVEVIIPKLQSCCGAPVRINGDYSTAKEMAKANIDVFLNEDIDFVVVACGTCGLTLKEEYIELFEDDPVYYKKAKLLGEKVKDITEILVSLEGFDQQFSNLPVKVTYHDPCHLVRGLKIKEQPRRLIKSIPGVIFKEMNKSDTCCGSAGSFSLYHYDLSTKINDHKIKDIEQSEAEVVVTGCSACRMHITDGLFRNNKNTKVKVMHTIELLEMAYKDKLKDI